MTRQAAERDPGRNTQFSRRWGDDPPRVSNIEHLGHEVAPRIVEEIGRRAIGRWLNKASEGHGPVAAEAFRQAGSIRRTIGLEWGDLIGQRAAA